MKWFSTADQLPAAAETVLLYLPNYACARPAIATLQRGDPHHPGAYYQADKWLCAALLALGGTQQRIEPDQFWARIPTPPGVDAWHPPALPEKPEKPDYGPLFGGTP